MNNDDLEKVARELLVKLAGMDFREPPTFDRWTSAARQGPSLGTRKNQGLLDNIDATFDRLPNGYGLKIIQNEHLTKTVMRPEPYKLKWWQHLLMYMTPFNPHWAVTPVRWVSKIIPSEEIIHDTAQNVIYCHPTIYQRIKKEFATGQ